MPSQSFEKALNLKEDADSVKSKSTNFFLESINSYFYNFQNKSSIL